MLTSIALLLAEPEGMDAVSKHLTGKLGHAYEVKTWKKMMPEIENHIKADGVSAYVFTGVLYLIIAFGFFGTVLMMTAERRYEFGMLIAIGMKKIKLGLMLLGETILISLTGVTLGIAVSLPLVYYLKINPIRFTGKLGKAYEQFGFEAIMPTELDAGIFTIHSLLVLGIALLIGLYPLWHVHKLDATKAMKR
jgi:ABC-type antimicrobial peptide transport system permease subunit